MASLFFNFVKRVLIIPAVITALVVGVLYNVVPKTLTQSVADSSYTGGSIDLSTYSVKDYKNFSQLSSGDYVGSISCENINLGKIAVLYHSDDDNAVYVAEGSAEPWNNGSMVLIGADNQRQFGKFYNSKKGDVIELDFYSKDNYTYKLKNKVYGVTKDQIKKYEKDSNLIIAVPYNDFSDLGNSYFYTLYIARKA